VAFVIKGARDLTYKSSGGFFVEFLKSEYHPIRRALEAYMMRDVIEGKDEATACGLMLGKVQHPWNIDVRVTSGGLRQIYRLDRWD
jgi:hypothetical protein